MLLFLAPCWILLRDFVVKLWISK